MVPVPLTAIDGLGRSVVLEVPPRRIVSLVPSTTETLSALGLAERVVGRTRFCVHPRPWVDTVPEVGGTKAVRYDDLAALEPDLIVANQEENKPEMWPRLEAVAPLWVAYPRNVDEALADLRGMGSVLGCRDRAEAQVSLIESARGAAHDATAGRAFRYAYLIWKHPWMTINADTFIDAMLGEVGGRNVFGEREPRYPEITLEELVGADPEVVFLSSEPFAFEPGHAAELGPLASRARTIDGEMASWHGVRMGAALAYLVSATRSA